MKVTLKKAHALGLELHGLASIITFPVSVELTEFDTVKKLETVKHENMQKISHKLNLIAAKYTLRDQVCVQNSAVGISDKLTDIARLTAEIGSLEGYLRQLPEKAVDREVVSATLEKYKAAENTEGYVSSTRVASDSKEEAVDILAIVSDRKLKRTGLKDEVTALNIITTIELSESMVDLLKKEKLVV